MNSHEGKSPESEEVWTWPLLEPDTMIGRSFLKASLLAVAAALLFVFISEELLRTSGIEETNVLLGSDDAYSTQKLPVSFGSILFEVQE